MIVVQILAVFAMVVIVGNIVGLAVRAVWQLVPRGTQRWLKSLVCRARLFGAPIVGHDDGQPVLRSQGLMSHGWVTERYTCKRCGHVTTVRWLS